MAKLEISLAWDPESILNFLMDKARASLIRSIMIIPDADAPYRVIIEGDFENLEKIRKDLNAVFAEERDNFVEACDYLGSLEIEGAED